MSARVVGDTPLAERGNATGEARETGATPRSASGVQSNPACTGRVEASSPAASPAGLVAAPLEPSVLPWCERCGDLSDADATRCEGCGGQLACGCAYCGTVFMPAPGGGHGKHRFCTTWCRKTHHRRTFARTYWTDRFTAAEIRELARWVA